MTQAWASSAAASSSPAPAASMRSATARPSAAGSAPSPSSESRTHVAAVGQPGEGVEAQGSVPQAGVRAHRGPAGRAQTGHQARSAVSSTSESWSVRRGRQLGGAGVVAAGLEQPGSPAPGPGVISRSGIAAPSVASQPRRGRPPPARARRSRPRPAGAAGCRRCRARRGPPGPAGAPAAAPGAAGSRCPPARPAGAPRSRRPAERVARVGALGHADDGQAVRQLAGHVLGRVHGEVDRPREQRLLDLLHEARLVLELRSGAPAGPLVARRADRDHLDRLARRLLEQAAHQVRLCERQRAAAASQPERHGSSGQPRRRRRAVSSVTSASGRSPSSVGAAASRPKSSRRACT